MTEAMVVYVPRTPLWFWDDFPLPPVRIDLRPGAVNRVPWWQMPLSVVWPQ
jgi:hypothetical protein